jgi:hypothetical protein
VELRVPLPPVACAIFLACIAGVIVENVTGSKPPL